MKQSMIKKLVFISLLWLAAVDVGAQNLVPNYSFEDTTNCPTPNVLETAFPWFQPTVGSSDHFHECDTFIIPLAGVPYNSFGYQYPKTGKAYAGFIAWGGGDWREYIEVPLNSTLVKNSSYCVEFHVSLADKPVYAVAIYRIGAVFSDDSLLGTGVTPLLNAPDVTNPIGDFIVDTNQWTLISGIYTASGGESFITIGNFFNNDSTDTINVGGVNGPSYYYIDDVFVREMDSIPNSISAGNVKIICEGESAVLGTTVQTGYTYHWQGPGLWDTTSAEITVSPNQTTDYVLTVTDTMPKPYSCQPTKTDTVTVLIAPCTDTLQYNVWLPNVFSPNNDNNNDVLFVRGNNIASMELAIYDRWGEKVFETNDISRGWGGSYNGSELNPGVYVYMGKVVFTDDTERELKGNVTLVR